MDNENVTKEQVSEAAEGLSEILLKSIELADTLVSILAEISENKIIGMTAIHLIHYKMRTQDEKSYTSVQHCFPDDVIADFEKILAKRDARSGHDD